MKKLLGAAVALTLTALVAPASADTIATFTLDHVTFNDGGNATGGFTLDLTTSTLSNVDITTSTDGEFGTTYTDGSFTNNPGSTNFFSGFFLGGDDLEITLGTALTASNLASTHSFAIANGSEAIYFLPLCGLNACETRTITGGSLDTGVSTTPLPAALPMFAGGLGMVGFLARRKKRKSTAA
jgi:hypothetical protein